MTGAQLNQFPVEALITDSAARAVRRLCSLQGAVSCLVARETARHYGMPVGEVLDRGAAARRPREETRRARDAAIYVMHVSLGYPMRQAARLYGLSEKTAGGKAVRRVEEAREGDPELDAFLDRLDALLRQEAER